MVDLKKILRKAFGNTSLENEDWLEPSATMLEEIEAKIYTKKKSRRWFFLLPVLLLLLTVGGICIGSKKINGKSVSAPTGIELVGNNTSFPMANSAVPDAKSTNLPEAAPMDLESVENKTPIISAINNHSKKMTSSAFKGEKVIPIDPNSISKQSYIPRFSSLEKSTNITQNTSDEKLLVEKRRAKKVLEVTTNSEKTSQLNLLDRLNLQKISSNKNFAIPSSIEAVLPKKSTWSVVAGASISRWDFKLNDTYQRALAPADFESSNGLGLRTFLGLDKKLGGRFSIGARLSYEQIEFTSGHNSSLEYDLDEETTQDLSNTKMVKMATPVGFVDSDLTIHRDSDLAGTEVVIDIKNRHRIQSLDLQLEVDYALPEFFGLQPSVSLGGGVQYIAKLSNELKSFMPEQTEFSAGKGAIVAGQSSLNRWSPTISTGFGLEKRVSKNLSIGINGNYLFNFNTLHEVNDFSTRLNRFNGGIYLRRSF